MGNEERGIRWAAPYGGSGNCVRLLFRKRPGCWIEWRPKLQVWDAICTDDAAGPMSWRMMRARKLRTDDLFAAIGFVRRFGYSTPIQDQLDHPRYPPLL